MKPFKTPFPLHKGQKQNLLALIGSLVLLSSVSSSAAIAESFSEKIEKAHGASGWAEKDIVKTDIKIAFGGALRLVGEMISNTEASKSRFTLEDKTQIVFDGSSAWISPSESKRERVRFDALTWPYFLAAPFKLRDPGTHLEESGQKPLFGKMYDTARLTFDSGVGDSPEDWYVLYRDPDTSLLKAMSYIVTYGKSAKTAGEPHIIVYEAFKELDGVKLATEWKFYKWTEEKGAKGKPIGQATLKDFSFPSESNTLFVRPEDAREDPLPQ